MAEQGEWLHTEEAAAYVNLTTTTIYRLVSDGKLTALRFPVRVSRQQLDTLFERCRIKPGELAAAGKVRVTSTSSTREQAAERARAGDGQMFTSPSAGDIDATALAQQVGGVLDRGDGLGGDAGSDDVVTDSGDDEAGELQSPG